MHYSYIYSIGSGSGGVVCARATCPEAVERVCGFPIPLPASLLVHLEEQLIIIVRLSINKYTQNYSKLANSLLFLHKFKLIKPK